MGVLANIIEVGKSIFIALACFVAGFYVGKMYKQLKTRAQDFKEFKELKKKNG